MKEVTDAPSHPPRPIQRATEAPRPVGNIQPIPTEGEPMEKAQAPVASDAVNVPALKEKLMALITNIKTLHTKADDLSAEMARVSLIVSNMEANALSVATEAKGDDGKKIHSNAEARKAGAEALLAKAPAYAEANKQLEQIKRDARTNEIELEYNRNLFRGMEIISRYR